MTWTNVDGRPHNFVVITADRNRVVRSTIMSEEGTTQTVEFEATQAMAEYFCQIHPTSMRGRLDVSGTATTGGGETTENATAEPTTTEEPPVIDEGPIVLGARAAYWLGLTPRGLQGRRNPTLRLRTGREYELVWINLDGLEHNFHLATAGGEDLADTSDREDVGDTRETDFEATSEAATYYCAFHPQSMRGDVESI